MWVKAPEGINWRPVQTVPWPQKSEGKICWTELANGFTVRYFFFLYKNEDHLNYFEVCVFTCPAIEWLFPIVQAQARYTVIVWNGSYVPVISLVCEFSEESCLLEEKLGVFFHHKNFPTHISTLTVLFVLLLFTLLPNHVVWLLCNVYWNWLFSDHARKRTFCWHDSACPRKISQNKQCADVRVSWSKQV